MFKKPFLEIGGAVGENEYSLGKVGELEPNREDD